MANLTAAQVRTIREPGRYGDGNGLYLVVSPGLTRSWVQRIYLEGKRADKGLGGWPAISLTTARKMAVTNKAAVENGRNPWSKEERERAARIEVLKRIPTFREAAYIVHDNGVESGRWRNGKHVKNWTQTLERHAFPTLADVPVDEISKADVMAVLTPLFKSRPETGRRIRQRMRDVFDWAVSLDHIQINPAGEAIRGGLKTLAAPAVQKHLDALPYEQVAGAMEKMRDSDSWKATKLAFELLVLTATRSNEVRGATWDEIQGDVWTIPASRMKARKEHRIPLSIQAQGVLGRARELSGVEWPDKPVGLVFPNPATGKALSDNTFSKWTRDNTLNCTPHGFRSSYRDWAAEKSGASYDVIELSLAHNVGNAVERAYFRSDLLDMRRPLMQAWADYLQPMPF